MQKDNLLLKNCFNLIKQRGYFYQSTGEKELEKLLTSKPTTIYLGIDPTADSLHIGHCYPLFMLKHLQKAGHKIIILIGGATAMIGDPSGRTDMREMVTQGFVNKNLESIKKIISKFLDSEGDNAYVIVNNHDWFSKINYVDFMREVGVHFNVNKMLATDAYATRMQEGGLTFFEMGYMLMQAYDFLYLNREYGCKLQVGGSDQWANMLAGAELGRKINNLENRPQEDFQAFTVSLLTTSSGVKMGKTQKGTIWVDENKTTPYEFYQYFYNVDDGDVEKLFKSTTELSLQEIKEIMSQDIVSAKKRFAYEITKAVHGEQNAKEASQASKNLFIKGDWSNAPEVAISKNDLPKDICDILVLAGLETSKGRARKLVQQNGVTLNNKLLTDFNLVINAESFGENNELLLKKGKKTFVKVVTK